MQRGLGGWEREGSISPKPQPAILLTDKASESRWQGNTVTHYTPTTADPGWRYLVLDFFNHLLLLCSPSSN